MALLDNPRRGLAKVRIEDFLDPVNVRRSYTLSLVDVVPNDAAGDQDGAGATAWKQIPGSAVTLRLEWDTLGATSWPQFNSAEIQARSWNGANLGTLWTPAINTVAGSATRTLRFDLDPLNAVAQALRHGTIELYFRLIRNDPAGWQYDTRDVFSGTAPVGTSRFAHQGFLQSPGSLVSVLVTRNATPGVGEEPSDKWEFGDPISVRAVTTPAPYANIPLGIAILGPASATQRQKLTAASVATTRDSTFNDPQPAAGGPPDAEAVVLSDMVGLSGVRLFWEDVIRPGQGVSLYSWREDDLPAGWALHSPANHIKHAIIDEARLDMDGRVTVTPQAEGDSVRSANDQLYVISADELYLFGRAVGVRGDPIAGKKIRHGLLKPDGSQANPDDATQEGTTDAAGWTPGQNLTQYLTAPAGSWTQRERFDSRNGTDGTIDEGTQPLFFASAYTAHRGLAVQVSADLVAGKPGTVLAEYRDSAGGLLLDAPPTLKIVNVTKLGVKTVVLVEPMVRADGSTIYFVDVPALPAAGRYTVDVLGTFAGGGVYGSVPITVRKPSRLGIVDGDVAIVTNA